MPGLTDWFDVFRCGSHVDRFGREVTITRDDIDAAIASYQTNSAPIVVGHPSLNAPAFGWIGAFRRIGDVVQAKASTVADEFADLVKRHLYKNRSLAFGPGPRFRHVGFLGAVAPAVKGLNEIQFATKEDVMDIEFSEPVPEPTAAAAPEAVPESAPAPEQASPQESSAEMRPAEQSQAEEAQAEDEEKLASDQRSVSSELDSLREDLKKAREEVARMQAEVKRAQAKSRHTEFAAYTDGLVKCGKLPAASCARVHEFMEFLDQSGSYEFSEGSEPVLERFKTLLDTVLKPVEFSELCTEAEAPAPSTPEDMARQIAAYRQEHKGANISEVMAHINGGK